MKKLLSVLLFFICLSAVSAAENNASLTEEQRLKEAGELYFSYEPEKALQAYIALSKDTQNKQAFLNAAYIAMERNSPKLAVDISLAGYRAHPQDREIIETLAEAYLADGQYVNAERLLSELPHDPFRAEFLHINLARAQMGLNEKNLAKYNFQMAARGNSHTALSNYLLGLLYEEEKDYKNAAEVFPKGLHLRPPIYRSQKTLRKCAGKNRQL